MNSIIDTNTEYNWQTTKNTALQRRKCLFYWLL